MKKNKGEWSELYVLLHILGNASLQAYIGVRRPYQLSTESVAGVDRKVGDTTVRYRIEGEFVHVRRDGGHLRYVPRADIRAWTSVLLNEITNGKATFEFSMYLEVNEALDLDDTVKSASVNKDDITVVVRNINSDEIRTVSYSIKSYLGASPTLVNASETTTRVQYQMDVAGDVRSVVSHINGIDGDSKVVSRIKYLDRMAVGQRDSVISHSRFRMNLSRIDCCLPRLLADLLWHSYVADDRRSNTVVESMSGELLSISDCIYKYKQFLSEAALGLTPDTEWNGALAVTGGFIVVGPSGEVQAFTASSRQEFWSYLYYLTKFDTPSTSKMNIATAEIVDGKLAIALSLQIRFVGFIEIREYLTSAQTT
jgi:hypothetical protein